jgi:hypothetical protein
LRTVEEIAVNLVEMRGEIGIEHFGCASRHVEAGMARDVVAVVMTKPVVRRPTVEDDEVLRVIREIGENRCRRFASGQAMGVGLPPGIDALELGIFAEVVGQQRPPEAAVALGDDVHCQPRL